MIKYFDSLNSWFNGKELKDEPLCQVCLSKEKTDTEYGPHIKKCLACGFVWRTPAPTTEVLDEFYKQSSPMSQWATIKDKQVARQREKFYYIWNFIKDNNIDSVLDVGCGNGFFLNEVDSAVGKVGVEKNGSARDRCKFPVYDSFDSFKNSIHGKKKYQMITMFGVLEHLKNPKKEIQNYSSFLKENGFLCFIVPNVKSLVVETLKDACSTFCPQHLWYFDPLSLSNLLSSENFMIESYLTLEPEVQPILKKIKGFDPYQDIGFDLTDKDITSENIYKSGKGYKICAFFKRR